jgi:galactokinase
MDHFAQAFGFNPEVIARAPGRVNLLGEHTDYNDGFVLPTTIPQETQVALAVSRTARFEFRSAQRREPVSFCDGKSAPEGYGRYVHGCIEVVRERGHIVPPLSIYINSTVPIGSGLSSSAALEVAVLRAIRLRFEFQLDDVSLALLARDAEARYAGVRCGIMDQMVASIGATDHMLLLDTRSLESSLLPLPPGAAIMVIDSGAPRSLAASGYNARRAECEAAAAALRVRALRDISDPSAIESLPHPLDRRARHVLTENARVLEAARGVSAAHFGELMNASHASLRDDFEVSTPELDILTSLLRTHPEVYGARLTGAGFGGACVALVRPSGRNIVKDDVLKEYATGGRRGTLLL